MENYAYNPSYPESGNSSPRSREIEFENPPPWEDHQPPPPNYKVKFMCSYGGKIHPRPHDNQLSYVGGETKILAVDRTVRFGSLISKLAALCDSDAISFKYQLPGEDLDALISVTNDDDLEHMMQEYDRLYRISPKPARLRLFIFPSLNSTPRSFASDEAKTEKERFVEALNSAPVMAAPPQSASPATAPPPSNVDFLFGLEKANAMAAAPFVVPGLDERIGSDPIQKHIHDLQRLRIEEQQGNYRRRSDDFSGGEYYKQPEKIPQVAVTGGVPYWPESQLPGGTFPASNNEQQQVYMIPSAPSNAYHAPVMRPVNVPPTQGYYAVQRIPSEVYSMIPQGTVPPAGAGPPPQKVAGGYSEGGFGMVRPEMGYGLQVAYDSGVGRQVIYSAPGGLVGAPASQYQAMGAEAGGKAVVAKATTPTQASM